MADINTQTTNILDKKKTTSALDTVGNVVMDSPNEDLKAPPNTLDEKYKAYEEGYNIGENFRPGKPFNDVEYIVGLKSYSIWLEGYLQDKDEYYLEIDNVTARNAAISTMKILESFSHCQRR